MAIFQCLLSGQTVEFTLQHDIDSMKGHNGYVRIDESGEPAEEPGRELPMTAPEPLKRVGRPRKISDTI